MAKQTKKFTTLNVRQMLRGMTSEQVLMTARGSVEELVSRNCLKCRPAMVIFDILSPENFGEARE